MRLFFESCVCYWQIFREWTRADYHPTIDHATCSGAILSSSRLSIIRTNLKVTLWCIWVVKKWHMPRHVLHCLVVGSLFLPWPLMVGLLRCDLCDFPAKDLLYSAEQYAGNVRIISKDSSFVSKLRAREDSDHSEVFLRAFHFSSSSLKLHSESMDHIFTPAS